MNINLRWLPPTITQVLIHSLTSVSKFNTPSLLDMSKALDRGLKENYKEVKVGVVDCPNLKQWGCPAEGISGNEKIIDVI